MNIFDQLQPYLSSQFSASIISQFAAHLNLLIKWNNAYNLTAIKNTQEMITHHVLDSLAILPFLKGNNIIDVGTGAGFPGIPLAIACPDKTFTLLDSQGKKIQFLNHVVLTLDLKNISIIQNRVEQYSPEILFDTVITRAFAPLPKMLKFCQHLLANHGVFLAMKGSYPNEELAALPKGFKTKFIESLVIPDLHETRHLIGIDYDG